MRLIDFWNRLDVWTQNLVLITMWTSAILFLWFS